MLIYDYLYMNIYVHFIIFYFFLKLFCYEDWKYENLCFYNLEF